MLSADELTEVARDAQCTKNLLSIIDVLAKFPDAGVKFANDESLMAQEPFLQGSVDMLAQNIDMITRSRSISAENFGSVASADELTARVYVMLRIARGMFGPPAPPPVPTAPIEAPPVLQAAAPSPLASGSCERAFVPPSAPVFTSGREAPRPDASALSRPLRPFTLPTATGGNEITDFLFSTRSVYDFTHGIKSEIQNGWDPVGKIGALTPELQITATQALVKDNGAVACLVYDLLAPAFVDARLVCPDVSRKTFCKVFDLSISETDLRLSVGLGPGQEWTAYHIITAARLLAIAETHTNMGIYYRITELASFFVAAAGAGVGSPDWDFTGAAFAKEVVAHVARCAATLARGSHIMRGDGRPSAVAAAAFTNQVASAAFATKAVKEALRAAAHDSDHFARDSGADGGKRAGKAGERGGYGGERDKRSKSDGPRTTIGGKVPEGVCTFWFNGGQCKNSADRCSKQHAMPLCTDFQKGLSDRRVCRFRHETVP
ncbi:hypothetical protein M885DRAFT_548720 [Pelagophyceae sp. CCMP2097]|nr:hypothetical protein M885DRAFT_548720 [Pelagophyceae sp. CCMP2097]